MHLEGYMHVVYTKSGWWCTTKVKQTVGKTDSNGKADERPKALSGTSPSRLGVHHMHVPLFKCIDNDFVT